MDRGDLRQRIVEAAAELVASGGPEAATTRAVATAASVQAPTIYRFFGDKRGLLDAVAEHEVARYVARKASRKPHADPVQDLRDGWDTHVAFLVEHPGVFAIMSGDAGESGSSITTGIEVLQRRVRRIAEAGRLRVEEKRAVALIQSAGMGVVRTLLLQPASERDLELSTLAREAVIAAISGKPAAPVKTGIRGAALALRASLDTTPVLSAGERLLLDELLARIVAGAENPT